MAQNADGRWEIDNELLHDLLTYGDGSPRVTGLKACWSIGHGFSIVKGIVTWLTMRALKIERLPWMADWPFSFLHYEQGGLIEAVRYLNDNPAEVQDACDELCAIHAHTQAFYAPNTSLRLGRGYKNDEPRSSRFGDFATTVMRHAQAAELLGQTEIHVPHDVLTSWGRHWAYTGCVVGVMMEIPTSEILCSAETLSPRPMEIGAHAFESGEFLVLNRRWDGILTLPTTNVEAIKSFNVRPPTQDEAQSVLDAGIPAMRRALHYVARDAERITAPQSFDSRLRRAWDILWARYQ